MNVKNDNSCPCTSVSRRFTRQMSWLLPAECPQKAMGCCCFSLQVPPCQFANLLRCVPCAPALALLAGTYCRWQPPATACQKPVCRVPVTDTSCSNELHGNMLSSILRCFILVPRDCKKKPRNRNQAGLSFLMDLEICRFASCFTFRLLKRKTSAQDWINLVILSSPQLARNLRRKSSIPKSGVCLLPTKRIQAGLRRGNPKSRTKNLVLSWHDC